MASFLSSADESWFAGAADTWFDTFKRSIVIHKEPLQTIKTTTSTQLFGYGQNGQTTTQEIEYTPRSQSFEAVIKYKSNQELELLGDIKAYAPDNNLVTIIVKTAARDYISKDKTEKIVLDGRSFNPISNGTLKYYFSTTYYEFTLQEIT